MVRLIDGPAADVELELRRAPEFLRVVINFNAEVDALDQLDDEPKPSEKIYVYRLTGEPSHGIACSRGKGCKPFVAADYSLYRQQPPDWIVRNQENWRRWAMAAHDREARVQSIESDGEA